VKAKVVGVKETKQKIKEYRDSIKAKVGDLVDTLTTEGANIARIKIVSMGAVYSGELLSGVSGYYSPLLKAGFIRVSSEHVAFVEFGTGIVGEGAQHPNGEYLAKANWKYNSGEHIFTTSDGRVGWIYPTDDGGFRFTEGMASRPFMYETAVELETKLKDIVREVFAVD
jgi:hypothetical protein